MTMTHLLRGHLLTLASEYRLCCDDLTRCIEDPDRQHRLPGAIRDCNNTLAAIADLVGTSSEAMATALRRGDSSIHQPHREIA